MTDETDRSDENKPDEGKPVKDKSENNVEETTDAPLGKTGRLEVEQVADALGGGPQENIPKVTAERIKQIAERVVVAVRILGIRVFLKDHQDKIFEKLKECERYADGVKFNGDMIFIALTLPVINGIIHVASTRRELAKATAWVLEEWTPDEQDVKDPGPEKVPILSALILIYTVAKGWRMYKDSPDAKERDIWDSICKRVQQLSTIKLEEYEEEDTDQE